MKKPFIALTALLFLAGVGCGNTNNQTKRTPVQQQTNAVTAQPTTDNTQPNTTEQQNQGSQVYNNKKYHFSFSYSTEVKPAEVTAEGEGGTVDETNPKNWGYSNQAVLLDKNNTYIFSVKAINPKLKFQDNGDATIPGSELSLKEFTTKVWEYNKLNPTKSVQSGLTALAPLTVGDKPAYQFSVAGSFTTPVGGGVLSEQTTYVFTESNGLKYMISYPAGMEISEKALETVKFLP